MVENWIDVEDVIKLKHIILNRLSVNNCEVEIVKGEYQLTIHYTKEDKQFTISILYNHSNRRIKQIMLGESNINGEPMGDNIIFTDNSLGIYWQEILFGVSMYINTLGYQAMDYTSLSSKAKEKIHSMVN